MQRLFIGAFFVFFGIFGILALRMVQVKNIPLFTPQSSTLTLKPPVQAITATLESTTGIVEQFTREADAYQEATPGGAIAQGESINVKQGSAIITMTTLGSVSMRDKAEISFVNLIPDSIMLLHKTGSIHYEVNTSSPFSIRALRALVELSGDATISVDDPTIKILLTKGTAKLALVDSENNTKIWNVVEGQVAQVNDKTKTVVLR